MVNVTKENFIEVCADTRPIITECHRVVTYLTIIDEFLYVCQESNDLLNNLPTAAFVAIDEEMTGISVSKGRPSKDQTPADRWSELKQAPERYNIIQLGVALFHPKSVSATVAKKSSNTRRGYSDVAPVSGCPSDTEMPHYTVRRYNFYMFPDEHEDREIVMSPSAVAFLNGHNMSFDTWTKHGIPFATATKGSEYLQTYLTKELEDRNPSTSQPTVQNLVKRRVELRRNEDIEFIAHAMASLREWLDSDVQNQLLDDDGEVASEGFSFLMPTCNSFLRRALYENIQAEYPALELESAGRQQIRVWRLNDEERIVRQNRLRRERWEGLILRNLGLWRVFEAIHVVCSGQRLDRTNLYFATNYEQVNWDNVSSSIDNPNTSPSQRMVPLVVHNGFMDICFLLSHFYSNKLPEDYQECKNLLSNYFPIIYDTKVISTECKCWANNDDQNSQNTNLASLFSSLVRDTNNNRTDGQKPLYSDQLEIIPAVSSVRGRVLVPDQEHEAAYDAYMTGAVFLGLCTMIGQNFQASTNFLDVLSERGSLEARIHYARNKLYQMSLYTMDLEERQPYRDPMSRGMLPESTYRVSGFDKAVSTRGMYNT